MLLLLNKIPAKTVEQQYHTEAGECTTQGMWHNWRWLNANRWHETKDRTTQEKSLKCIEVEEERLSNLCAQKIWFEFENNGYAPHQWGLISKHTHTHPTCISRPLGSRWGDSTEIIIKYSFVISSDCRCRRRRGHRVMHSQCNRLTSIMKPFNSLNLCILPK